MDWIYKLRKISVDAIAVGTVGWAFALCVCARGDTMMYRIEPESVVHDEYSLALDLRQAKVDEWEVAFTIAGKPLDHTLNAASFEVKVIDVAGQPLPEIGNWESSLVEVGGSMSMTVNGSFRFRDTGSRLANVSVKWNGELLGFRLIPR